MTVSRAISHSLFNKDDSEMRARSLEVLTPESAHWDKFADRLLRIITADGCNGAQEPKFIDTPSKS